MEENQAFPKVDVHYNGTFVPNLLVYFAPQVLHLNEDANELGFSDFVKYVEKLIDFQCKHVYYCIPEVRLSEELQTIQNECNYSEFLEVANANRHVDVYIDHDNEPLFEWIQKEEPDDEDLVYSEEDVDSVLADDENCKHEEDESVTSSKRIFKRTYNDKFLNKLCPVVVEDEDEKGNQLLVVYPRHDATQEWRKMKPELGMRFSSPAKLKSSLSNYAVAHGYDLYYEKNDKDRNAKRFALCEIEGDLKDHYSKLWDYGAEIKRANPRSHVEVYVQPQNNSIVVFERFYVSFKGVVDGWLDRCRKVIGIDGCFLKGICKGELLSAVGWDGNNNIYPIAWAVVNVENKNNWKWLLYNLMEDIDEGEMGIMEVVKERYLEVEHRLFARHILANFHKKFKGECYIKPYWRAVKATTIPKFELAMEEIKSFDVGACDYLIKRDPKCWSRAFFKVGMGCDAMENGVSESFNVAIEEARKKPFITMLEDIRVFVMERLYMQKGKGLGWDLAICPTIRRKLDSRHHMLVDTSSLKLCNVMKEELVAEWFTKSAFLRVYEYTIHPVNDSTLWPHMPDFHQILPPIRRRLPGRPCVKRKRDQAENELSGYTRHTISRAGVQHRCTICNETGHNKATCPMRGPSEAGPSKARKKSNARNCPSQAGPSTPAPSAPTHVNQDPLTQDHVPVNEDPMNQENVNEVLVNEVPINQDLVIPVPVNQVPVNLGVRVPRRLGVRARKP
ncbi:unnamed protein product [Lactuca saligna]|uniref:MULE transposase domain-containing protein n=1 Tax=Lactuca saligna TaxID=75948 RepID=A0AA36E918_LACSI|nr:unnamed protein product [Lactuca saligna]